MPAEGAEEVAAAGNFIPLMSVRTPLSLALVADDDRLWTSAEELLGDITIASPALATCLVADTPWHHDPGIGDPWLRFNAYLQPAAASTGALRVVAGSHVPELGRGVGSYLASVGVEWRDRPNALPGFALETEPGDVIGFDPRLYHGAWGSGRRLRWNVDYAQFPAATDSVRRAKIRDLVRELSDWPHPPQWPVWNDWLQEDAPASRAHAIDNLTELGAL
jgi:hypothetical protein